MHNALLQNYRERVSRRHFGTIKYTKSYWKWILSTLSREMIHGKSAWKRSISFSCWQITSTSAIQNAKSEVKRSNAMSHKATKHLSYMLCRLWQAVCNWRNLEVEIPCLYTQSANGGTRVLEPERDAASMQGMHINGTNILHMHNVICCSQVSPNYYRIALS